MRPPRPPGRKRRKDNAPVRGASYLRKRGKRVETHTPYQLVRVDSDRARAGHFDRACPSESAGPAETFLRPIGTLFLNVVKLLIVPLVFSSITVGVCGLGDAKSVGRVGGKTIVFYLLTTAVAVTVGLLAANLFPVGRGMGLTAPTIPAGEGETPDVISTLLNMVPSNPVAALAEGNMLQIIVTALILGGGILIAGDRGRPLFLVMESLADVMYALTGAVMKFAPLAVFALIAPVVAQYGPSVLLDLLGVITLVYGACLVHALVVYSSAVAALGRTGPLRFFKECAPAALFAFSSSSSAATLPFALDAAERLGASHPVRSFVLPLGATINMDGPPSIRVCAPCSLPTPTASP